MTEQMNILFCLSYGIFIEKVENLRIIASSEEAGVYAVTTPNGKQIFITGHKSAHTISG